MTLDDLIALNAEIAALVRAGVPLEVGLTDLGADLPGRLGRHARALAERTARGESLAQALAADQGQLPRAYRAVVEAGIRAGRLPAALESVATSARRLWETYRVAAISMTYVLVILLVGWGGLLVSACLVAPRFVTSYSAMGLPVHPLLGAMAAAGRTAWYWGPAVPVCLVLLAMACWLTSTRWAGFHGGWGDRLFRWIPWIGTMLRYSRTATFLDVLALLVENETPLPEAIILSAETSGDEGTVRLARRVAATLADGQTRPAPEEARFPPLVNWLLLSANRGGALLPALQHAAATYHRRARHQSDLVRTFLPIVLTVGVAGIATAMYGVLLFAPYASMLQALGR